MLTKTVLLKEEKLTVKVDPYDVHLSRRAVAHLLGVTIGTVINRIRDGQLTEHRYEDARSYYITLEDALSFMARQQLEARKVEFVEVDHTE